MKRLIGQDIATMYEENIYIYEHEKTSSSEKKRRLSVYQVKALEKNFEVENKLEPDRKAKLAEELGLKPRQVAVWYQNRRARWKNKQLEKDYGVLKDGFDALKSEFESEKLENEGLKKEIQELKAKLKEENTQSKISIKEEPNAFGTDDQVMESAYTKPPSNSSPYESIEPETYPLCNIYNDHTSIIKYGVGASDSSDSNAILNYEDNNSPKVAMSSSPFLHFMDANSAYRPQFVKIEDQDFFTGNEACDFFLIDQAPSLHW